MNLPLNIDWHQIIMHLFNFAILAFGLYILLYKPVKQFMDKRIEHYKSLEEEANKNLQQSEAAKQEYTEKLKTVDEEIENKRQEAYRSIAESTEKSRLSAKKEADEIIAAARERAEREHDKIVEGAQNEIAGIVASAAEKLVLQSSTAESYDQFLAAVEGGGKNEQ